MQQGRRLASFGKFVFPACVRKAIEISEGARNRLSLVLREGFREQFFQGGELGMRLFLWGRRLRAGLGSQRRQHGCGSCSLGKLSPGDALGHGFCFDRLATLSFSNRSRLSILGTRLYLAAGMISKGEHEDRTF